MPWNALQRVLQYAAARAARQGTPATRTTALVAPGTATRCCPSSQCTKSYSSYTLPSTSPTEAPSNSPTTAAPTAPTRPTSSPTTLEWDACEKHKSDGLRISGGCAALRGGDTTQAGHVHREACTAPGWPIYGSWGNDVDACPCTPVQQHVQRVLIDSARAATTSMEDDCLTAFAEIFPRRLPRPRRPEHPARLRGRRTAPSARTTVRRF